MGKKISMDFGIRRRRPLCGRGRPLYKCGRSFYGRAVHVFPMSENVIHSDSFLDSLKADANFHFMDTDVYFNVKFERQIAVELHFDWQINPCLYSVTAYPRICDIDFRVRFRNTDKNNL